MLLLPQIGERALGIAVSVCDYEGRALAGQGIFAGNAKILTACLPLAANDLYQNDLVGVIPCLGAYRRRVLWRDELSAPNHLADCGLGAPRKGLAGRRFASSNPATIAQTGNFRARYIQWMCGCQPARGLSMVEQKGIEPSTSGLQSPGLLIVLPLSANGLDAVLESQVPKSYPNPIRFSAEMLKRAASALLFLWVGLLPCAFAILICLGLSEAAEFFWFRLHFFLDIRDTRDIKEQ